MPTAARHTSGAVPVIIAAPNQPPIVSADEPGQRREFHGAGDDHADGATASGSGGPADRVEFYNGTTLLGTDTTAPYDVLVDERRGGHYSLTAAAYDEAGSESNLGAGDRHGR